ncbi:hypothetical protein T492DRAFT_847044 [Pavlovales sp. CCMP2436]|nr:hypothetical protein T492DRAFT_847044 [Pavlovales sp. CCMP2436]
MAGGLWRALWGLTALATSTSAPLAGTPLVVGAGCATQPRFATLDAGTGVLAFACGRSWEVDLVADADCGPDAGGCCHPRYTFGPLSGEVELFRAPLVVRREYVHAYCDVWPLGRAEQVFVRPIERAAVRARVAAANSSRDIVLAAAVARNASSSTHAPLDMVLLLFEGTCAAQLDAILPRTLARLRQLGSASSSNSGPNLTQGGGGGGEVSSGGMLAASFRVHATDGLTAAERWRALFGSCDGEGSRALCALRRSGYMSALAADRCASNALDAVGLTVEVAAELAGAAAAEDANTAAGADDSPPEPAAESACVDHLLLQPFCAPALQLAARTGAPRCVGGESAHRVALRYAEQLLSALPRQLYPAAPRLVAAALDAGAGGATLDADLAAWLGALVAQRRALGASIPAILLWADGGDDGGGGGGEGAAEGALHLLLPAAALGRARCGAECVRANAAAGPVSVLDVRQTLLDLAGLAAADSQEAGSEPAVSQPAGSQEAGSEPESFSWTEARRAAASLLRPLPIESALPQLPRAPAAATPSPPAQPQPPQPPSPLGEGARSSPPPAHFSCPLPLPRAPRTRCTHARGPPPNATLLAELRAQSDALSCAAVRSFASLSADGWLDLSGCDTESGAELAGYSLGWEPRLFAYPAPAPAHSGQAGQAGQRAGAAAVGPRGVQLPADTEVVFSYCLRPSAAVVVNSTTGARLADTGAADTETADTGAMDTGSADTGAVGSGAVGSVGSAPQTDSFCAAAPSPRRLSNHALLKLRCEMEVMCV